MKNVLFFVFILTSLFASDQKATICLNMIVKNESASIERCLSSVMRLIDYWVIVDTGSDDGTQETIRKVLKNIPGELHEQPWISFEKNRNQALALAKDKADYLLFIDADEVFEYAKDFSLPVLDKDFYFVTVCQVDAVKFNRASLIRAKLPWKWEGILHETVSCSEVKTSGLLEGVINYCNTGPESGRSKGLSKEEKYDRDGKLLLEAIEREPSNSRYYFYAGQSYLAAKKYELAKELFVKRTQMESKDTEETFRAFYNIGLAEEMLDQYDTAIKSYYKAYTYRPIRAEPLFRMAVLHRKQGNALLGYLLCKFALSIPTPKYEAIIEYKVYDTDLWIEFGNCSLLLGRWEEGVEACSRLLAHPDLEQSTRETVLKNLLLAERNLAKSDVTP